MTDIFDLTDIQEQKPVELTKYEFIQKAKDIFKWLDKEYGQHYYNRRLKDGEYDNAPCEGCKGSGCFKEDENSKEVNCIADFEDGECYERLFDADEFVASIETEILFGENSIYDLLNCKINP